MREKKKALVVCGPTASGKSQLSDSLAEWLSAAWGAYVRTLAVDSMQVYREIPNITNQPRGRPAELVSIVSVTEGWTVAHHRARAEEITAGLEPPFVLDAGTGMYLNAILLDFSLAPRVEPGVRRLAQESSAAAPNPRHAARARELLLAGAPPRGSVWGGGLRFDTSVVYLRPPREALDAAISKRSREIARAGLEEAATLGNMTAAGATISASVGDSIGVRELTEYLAGNATIEEAEARISARTRQMARRQLRWFDKLARTLEGRADIEVFESPADIDITTYMHDRMRA